MRNTQNCSRCRGPNDRQPQRYCSSCHAGDQRDRRAARPEHGLTADEWALIQAIRMTGGARLTAALLAPAALPEVPAGPAPGRAHGPQ